jgi:hypothetical protein
VTISVRSTGSVIQGGTNARDGRRVRSVRDIPRWCECRWLPDYKVTPAEWTLTEVAPGCQVHGERP